MPAASTEETIRSILEDILEDAAGSDPLLDRDVDSLSLEQLIDILEEEYEIFFGEQDVARENFRSIPILAALVDAKRAEGPARLRPS